MQSFWRQPGLPAPAAEVGRGRHCPKQGQQAVPRAERVVNLDPGKHLVVPGPARRAVRHRQAERPLPPSPRVGQQVVLTPARPAIPEPREVTLVVLAAWEAAEPAVPSQSTLASRPVERRNRVVEQVGEATEARRVRTEPPRQVGRSDQAEARLCQRVETPAEPAGQEERRPSAVTPPSAPS